jgi:hypothetical protein
VCHEAAVDVGFLLFEYAMYVRQGSRQHSWTYRQGGRHICFYRQAFRRQA